VLGFDDAPLTTVRQPMAAIGRMATEMLVRLLAGEKLEIVRVELATTLITRESTAPPRTR
jgi:LacI family transcriptional regulator